MALTVLEDFYITHSDKVWLVKNKIYVNSNLIMIILLKTGDQTKKQIPISRKLYTT